MSAALAGEAGEARAELEDQIGGSDQLPQWYVDLVKHYRPFLLDEHR